MEVILKPNCVNMTAEIQKAIDDCFLNGGGKIVLEKGTYEIGGIAIYNSSYYDKALLEIEYIDFGDGNAVLYPQFCYDKYINEETEFIFPNSAFTIEFLNTFEADHVVICVKTTDAAALNEIMVLGR